MLRWYVNGNLEGVFVMDVDDFLYAGTENFKKIVITKTQGLDITQTEERTE